MKSRLHRPLYPVLDQAFLNAFAQSFPCKEAVAVPPPLGWRAPTQTSLPKGRLAFWINASHTAKNDALPCSASNAVCQTPQLYNNPTFQQKTTSLHNRICKEVVKPFDSLFALFTAFQGCFSCFKRSGRSDFVISSACSSRQRSILAWCPEIRTSGTLTP